MISILMPIYNGIEFMDESITSILEQTYNHWELLVGINGHTENSIVYQKAKEYEKVSDKIRVFDFYEIKGKSNTLNKMLPLCRFNYVALLDVDDVWHKKKLEIQSHYFVNNYDVIGTLGIWFGDKKGMPNIPPGDISAFNFSLVNPIINSSAIIKKDLCYWNVIEDGVEDYDLWLNLRKNGRRFYNCKEILVKHRIHESSAFNSKGNNNKVDNLLNKYGFKSREKPSRKLSKIIAPKIKKMAMALY